MSPAKTDIKEKDITENNVVTIFVVNWNETQKLTYILYVDINIKK